MLLVLFAFSCKNSNDQSIEKANEIIKNIKENEYQDNETEKNKINVTLLESDYHLQIVIDTIYGIVRNDYFNVRDDQYSTSTKKDGIQFDILYTLKNLNDKTLNIQGINYLDPNLCLIAKDDSFENIIKKEIKYNDITEPNQLFFAKTDYFLQSIEIKKNEEIKMLASFNGKADPDLDIYLGGFLTKSEDNNWYRIYLKIEKDIERSKSNEFFYYKITDKIFEKVDELYGYFNSNTIL